MTPEERLAAAIVSAVRGPGFTNIEAVSLEIVAALREIHGGLPAAVRSDALLAYANATSGIAPLSRGEQAARRVEGVNAAIDVAVEYFIREKMR